MSRQFKGKHNVKNIEPLLAPKAFLDAAHGYSTTKGDCGKSTTFASLITTAKNAGLVTDHELQRTFNMTDKQLERAKKNQSTGVDGETRVRFISAMTERAHARA